MAAMDEAPSPYTPGIIGDERPPPRPAGRAVVFLVATFVMAIVTSELWQEWSRRAMVINGSTASVNAVVGLASLPGVLILLWAYLSDAVPLWGTRREGYLMLACLVAAVAWLAVAVANGHHIAWLVAAVPLGFAASMSRAAIAGALTEIGQRRAATGAYAASRTALVSLASLASQPLLVWSAWAAYASIWLIAGVAAGLALAVLGLTATLSDTAAPVLAPPPPVTIGRFLRSRALWTAVPLLVCAGIARVPQGLLMLELRETHADRFLMLFPGWEGPAVAIAAAVVYLLASRRVGFAPLLGLALLAKAAALAALALAYNGMAEGPLRLALLAQAACHGLAIVAILDLAMRMAPTGREAFGVVLVAGVPNVLTTAVDTVAISLQVPAGRLAWFAAGAALAAAIAVRLLPREITDRPVGRMVVSPP